MIRQIKTVTLAIFAALAMSSLPASAAEFHSESAHTTIAGAQHAGEDSFIVNAGLVRCNEVTYAGTQSVGTASTITVIPTYINCTINRYGTTIKTNGCSYIFSVQAPTVTPVTGSGTGSFTIECPAGAFIEVPLPNACDVQIGPQGPIPGITYTNTGAHSGSARDVTVDVNMTGIKYTQVNTSFCKGGTFTNGQYVGAATVQGKTTEGAAAGIWVH